MVYATIKEAWGSENVSKIPTEKENYFLPNSVVIPANFNNFYDNFQKNMNQVLPDMKDELYDAKRRIHHNDSIYSNNRSRDQPTPFRPKLNTNNNKEYMDYCNNNYRDKYFLEDDELSQMTHSSINTDNSGQPLKKVIGKQMYINEHKKPKNTSKKHVEKFQNFELTHDNNCGNLLEHVKRCSACRKYLEENNKNTFLKEFIVFSSSGVLMLLFLQILFKIASRK